MSLGAFGGTPHTFPTSGALKLSSSPHVAFRPHSGSPGILPRLYSKKYVALNGGNFLLKNRLLVLIKKTKTQFGFLLIASFAAITPATLRVGKKAHPKTGNKDKSAAGRPR